MQIPEEALQRFKYRLEEIAADKDETPGPTTVMLRDVLNLSFSEVQDAVHETMSDLKQPHDSPLSDVLETWWQGLNKPFSTM